MWLRVGMWTCLGGPPSVSNPLTWPGFPRSSRRPRRHGLRRRSDARCAITPTTTTMPTRITRALKWATLYALSATTRHTDRPRPAPDAWGCAFSAPPTASPTVAPVILAHGATAAPTQASPSRASRPATPAISCRAEGAASACSGVASTRATCAIAARSRRARAHPGRPWRALARSSELGLVLGPAPVATVGSPSRGRAKAAEPAHTAAAFEP